MVEPIDKAPRVPGNPDRQAIVNAISALEQPTITEISQAAGFKRSVVRTHIFRLSQSGVVEEQETGEKTRYSLTQEWSESTDQQAGKRKGSNESCFICGCTQDHKLEDHHIIPRRFGGEDTQENTITVCGNCHRSLEAIYTDRVWQQFAVDQDPGHRSESAVVTDHEAKSPAGGLTENAVQILDRLETEQWTTRQELIKALGVSDTTVTTRTQELLEAGLIEAETHHRERRYRLTE